MFKIKKRKLLSLLALSSTLFFSSLNAHADADCNGINEYPDWTAKDWPGGENNHAESGDKMVYQNELFQANWYTNSVPGSDTSWNYLGTCGASSSSSTSSGSTSSSTSSGSGAFTSQDIGVTGAAGNSIFDSEVLTVTGSGGDIAGTADGFQFSYMPLEGDGQITARITDISNIDSWTKFGVMIRKDLSDNAANLLFLLRPEAGSAIQYRENAGGSTSSSWTESSSTDISDFPDRDVRYFKVGKWLRLTKQGSVITSYTSEDGLCWVKRRNLNLPALAGDAYYGLALTSHNFGTLAQGQADNVEITSQIEPHNSNCPRAAVDGYSEIAIDYSNLPHDSEDIVAEGYDLLADYFNKYVKENEIPGAQLAIMKDNNSFANCTLDLPENYGVSGDIVVRNSVGYKSIQLNANVNHNTRFRLASVDKMVSKAIIVEIFKRGLYDLGYSRPLTVITPTGPTQKLLADIPFADIPVLSYLRDYLQIDITPYPGLADYPQWMDEITINQLLTFRHGLQDWNPTSEQEAKDLANGISFDYEYEHDYKKFLMLEKAAFDYGISMNEWRPIHLVRWIFSQDLKGRPGTDDVAGYGSNGIFILRYLADEILKKNGSTLLQFMQNDMGLSDMIITNDKLQDRHPEETGFFLHIGPEEFLDRRPFLDHYFAIGSSAEQLAKYFENYMIEYTWDQASGRFTADAGGAPGKSVGAWATAKHNKCHNDTLEKHSIAAVTNKQNIYDPLTEHLARAIYNSPHCSRGSNFTLPWDYNTDYLMKAHGNLLTYLGIETNSNNLATRFDKNNSISSEWQISDVDGEYVRISNGSLFLHAEYEDSTGMPLVAAAPYSGTLSGWWSAQWKLEAGEQANTYRIRNRYRSNLYLSASRDDDDFSNDLGTVTLMDIGSGEESILWSFCTE